MLSRAVWRLNSRSLHFGHSAFLALKEYLTAVRPELAEGRDTVSLAVRSILHDILTGVITPKTSGDLEISLATLSRLAKQYGVISYPSQVSFDDLKNLVRPELVEGRISPAIAHVDGNHYILITQIAADGTVTYREPNQGPTGQTLTM